MKKMLIKHKHKVELSKKSENSLISELRVDLRIIPRQGRN